MMVCLLLLKSLAQCIEGFLIGGSHSNGINNAQQREIFNDKGRLTVACRVVLMVFVKATLLMFQSNRRSLLIQQMWLLMVSIPSTCFLCVHNCDIAWTAASGGMGGTHVHIGAVHGMWHMGL
jgi:hypothetical protein